MTSTVLVTGATGNVGHAAVAALVDAGIRTVAFSRDERRAREILGPAVEVRTGDLADEHALGAALRAVDAVLLSSGNDPALRELQLMAVRTIAAAGVARVVKISGSPVSIARRDAARTGADHAAVEEALRAAQPQAVAIRPNVFMQNLLDQALAVAHGALPGPAGDPRVSFVDAADVGRVAAAALRARAHPGDVLEVTGPEALTWFDVAERMTQVLPQTVTHHPVPPDLVREGLRAMGRPDWQIDHALELSALFGDPRAAEVTGTVERCTGRPATSLTTFLERHAAELSPVG